MSSQGTNSSGLILAHTGSYPRIGDAADLQVLRRTIAAADRGERTSADLADAESEMTRRAIADQVRAGVDLLTDGMIRWYDPISYRPANSKTFKSRGCCDFSIPILIFGSPCCKELRSAEVPWWWKNLRLPEMHWATCRPRRTREASWRSSRS